MDRTLLWLLLGLVILLAVATVVGQMLAQRASGASAIATMDNLNKRIRAWWLMVAVLAIAFFFGKAVTLVLFALTSFYCLREFISLTPTRPADHAALAAAFYVFLPLQYILIGIDWQTLFSIAIPVYAFLALPALAVLRHETDGFLERSAKVQWALMLTVYCISHAPALLLLKIPGFEGRNVLLLFFLIFVVQASDVLQYVFGKLFGRHPIAPVVSPNKTWEGFVGGGATATLLGACLWWATPFTPLQAAGLALAIVLAGFCGGLVLSAVKRSMGAKDWGTMISGHGGALDRMDSVTYAAPLFFHLVNFYFVP
ncbi:phosphatidate cytidylyltransferase [Aureimonas altamirensis DSM 21988]|uniref:Phosphatidate cytidylyltransferase n=2 Tax=Aureimonas altamirensis TaxID=370622 RepID=A0A0P0YXS9_9HYPH|nr:phosphatidate cytidylyltransferase [Aureimonas altamirensis]BAT26253.1 phosphatidate cytidylyltransferase [Aureimonas altamirensis]SHJ42227.1 phosphatidate cytidylyltransferase [Aureimonas altamirensis DSM 21988]